MAITHKVLHRRRTISGSEFDNNHSSDAPGSSDNCDDEAEAAALSPTITETQSIPSASSPATNVSSSPVVELLAPSLKLALKNTSSSPLIETPTIALPHITAGPPSAMPTKRSRASMPTTTEMLVNGSGIIVSSLSASTPIYAQRISTSFVFLFPLVWNIPIGFTEKRTG